VEVVLAGVAQGHFGLTPVDALPGAVAIAVAMSARVLGAVGVAATLAPDIEGIGAVVAALGLLTPLDLGCLGGLLLQLAAIGSAAETAY